MCRLGWCYTVATELLRLVPNNLRRRRRKAAQDATIKEDSKRLEELSQMVAQLASKQETVLRDQLEAVRRRHVQLCQQLLHVLRHVSVRRKCWRERVFSAMPAVRFVRAMMSREDRHTNSSCCLCIRQTQLYSSYLRISWL